MLWKSPVVSGGIFLGKIAVTVAFFSYVYFSSKSAGVYTWTLREKSPCLKFSGPYFLVFGRNTKTYSVIQKNSECRRFFTQQKSAKITKIPSKSKVVFLQKYWHQQNYQKHAMYYSKFVLKNAQVSYFYHSKNMIP